MGVVWDSGRPWSPNQKPRLRGINGTGLFTTSHEGLEEAVHSASEIVVVGVTLNRTLSTMYSALQQRLAAGGSLKVVTLDPQSAALSIATARNYAMRDEKVVRAKLGETVDLCRELASDGANVELRRIDSPLSFGALAIDAGIDSLTAPSSEARLFIEHYPFRTVNGSLPKFELSYEDGRWFEQFRMEVSNLWDSAIPVTL